MIIKPVIQTSTLQTTQHFEKTAMSTEISSLREQYIRELNEDNKNLSDVMELIFRILKCDVTWSGPEMNNCYEVTHIPKSDISLNSNTKYYVHGDNAYFLIPRKSQTSAMLSCDLTVDEEDAIVTKIVEKMREEEKQRKYEEKNTKQYSLRTISVYEYTKGQGTYVAQNGKYYALTPVFFSELPATPGLRVHTVEPVAIKPVKHTKFHGYTLSVFSWTSFDTPIDVTTRIVNHEIIYFATKRISVEQFLFVCAELLQNNPLYKVVSHAWTPKSSRECIPEFIGDLKDKEIIFNFECCSGFGCFFDSNFETLACVAVLIRSGYTVVFADWSLRSLITNWDKAVSTKHQVISILGTCPFKEVGQFHGKMSIDYSSETFKNCLFPQFKVLGNISETVGGKSTIIVEAMGNTIVFGVNSTEKAPPTCALNDVVQASTEIAPITTNHIPETPAKSNDYVLEVLSVVTKYSNSGEETFPVQFATNASGTEITGMIGHAILKFPEGGQLIVSAGHFCELEKIAVSRDCLMKELQRLPKNERDKYIREITEAEKSGVAENVRDACCRASSDLLRSSS